MRMFSAVVLAAPLDKVPDDQLGFWAAFMSLLLGGLGVFLLWVGIVDLRRLVRGLSTRDMAFGELKETRHGKRVRVRGVAEAGPGGVLRAPVTDLPCVWWEVVSYETKEGDTGLPDHESAFSDALITVRDATESVVVGPHEVRIWGAKQSKHEFHPSDRPGVTVHKSELILLEGTEVVLSGRAVLADDGALTMAEPLLRTAVGAPTAGSPLPMMLIGLIGGSASLGVSVLLLTELIAPL